MKITKVALKSCSKHHHGSNGPGGDAVACKLRELIAVEIHVVPSKKLTKPSCLTTLWKTVKKPETDPQILWEWQYHPISDLETVHVHVHVSLF